MVFSVFPPTDRLTCTAAMPELSGITTVPLISP